MVYHIEKHTGKRIQMAQDPTSFLLSLAALALIIERVVEKGFSWIPEYLREKRLTSDFVKKRIGNIMAVFVFLIGWFIAYQGNIYTIKILFMKDVSVFWDTFTTALFITGGADTIHQIIRFGEEKKESAKEDREHRMRKRIEAKETVN
jgi:hypothetical protein